MQNETAEKQHTKQGDHWAMSALRENSGVVASKRHLKHAPFLHRVFPEAAQLQATPIQVAVRSKKFAPEQSSKQMNLVLN